MATTNGFDATRVLADLNARIKWQQEVGVVTLTSANLNGTSGRTFNGGGFHNSMTLQNIYDCQPNRNITPEQFNTYLVDRKNEMLLSMLNTVFTDNQYIESGLLCRKWPNSQLNPIVNGGKFVFWKINVAPGDYSVRIDNIHLLFDAAATFMLYLFNDLVGKISETSVTVAANVLKVQSLAMELTYQNATIKGGQFFLGYFQDDLNGAQALNYNYCPADTCVYGAVPGSSVITSPTTFNMFNYSTGSEMYGMNIEMSAYRDITQSIVLNAHLFDELQGLFMAKSVVELILNSTRTNDVQRITQDNLRKWTTDLKGFKDPETGQWFPSFDYRIAKEIKRVKESLQPSPKAINVSLI